MWWSLHWYEYQLVVGQGLIAFCRELYERVSIGISSTNVFQIFSIAKCIMVQHTTKIISSLFKLERNRKRELPWCLTRKNCVRNGLVLPGKVAQIHTTLYSWRIFSPCQVRVTWSCWRISRTEQLTRLFWSTIDKFDLPGTVAYINQEPAIYGFIVNCLKRI